MNMGATAPPTPPPGGTAGTGVAVPAQRVAPPPSPEAYGAYAKKGEERSAQSACLHRVGPQRCSDVSRHADQIRRQGQTFIWTSSRIDQPDRLVTLKPPGWEVADQKQPLEERQLSSFLQARLPSSLCPALRDAAHAHGVLHRLDAPSSGLALAANTFDAFYDLTMLLNAGEVAR